MPKFFSILFSILIPLVVWSTSQDPDPSLYRPHVRPNNNLGNAYLKVGRYAEAKEQFIIAIQRQPGLTDTIVNIGVADHNMGNLKEAEAFYREAISRNRDLGGAHHNLAVLLLKKNNLELAAYEYSEAIRCGHRTSDSYNTPPVFWFFFICSSMSCLFLAS